MPYIKSITLLLIASLSTYFSACKNVQHVDTTKQNTVRQVVTVKSDTAQVKSNIVAFLRWYKNNYKKANAYPILMKDSSENYMVNHAAYSDYLNFIKSSQLISPEYISYWKTYFDDKETELRTYPIKTVAPEGFDFDIVLITQKPEAILNKLDVLRYKIISMSDSVALVSMKLPHNKSAEYEIEMRKENNGWQIGFISNPNYD